MNTLSIASSIFVFAAAAALCQETPTNATANALKGRPYSPYADRAYLERVFFGDTHFIPAFQRMQAAAERG